MPAPASSTRLLARLGALFALVYVGLVAIGLALVYEWRGHGAAVAIGTFAILSLLTWHAGEEHAAQDALEQRATRRLAAALWAFAAAAFVVGAVWLAEQAITINQLQNPGLLNGYNDVYLVSYHGAAGAIATVAVFIAAGFGVVIRRLAGPLITRGLERPVDPSKLRPRRSWIKSALGPRYERFDDE